MPHPTTLVVLAGLGLAGAALGTTLGRQTVAEINPAYMQDPEVPFYSDLVPGQRPRADWAQVQAQEYQASSEAAPQATCPGCTWPVAPAPREDPVVARYDTPHSASLPRERSEPATRVVIVEEASEPEWRQVERYTRYPVYREPPPPPADDYGDGDGGDEGDGGTQ